MAVGTDRTGDEGSLGGMDWIGRGVRVLMHRGICV